MTLKWNENPNGAKAFILCICFTTVSALFVAIRLWIRIAKLKKYYLDDFIIVGALLATIGFTVMIGCQRGQGLGMHYWELQAIGLGPKKALHYLFISIFFYYASLAGIKLALVVQYHRLFKFHAQQQQSVVLGVLLLANFIQSALTTALVCRPAKKFWEHATPGVCVNTSILWPFNASMNILTDLCLIILPIPAVQKLKLPRKTKRALIIVFAAGGSGCIISMMRLHSIVAIASSNDKQYMNAYTGVWSSAESNLGLICACLPALRPILSQYFSGIFGTSADTRSDGHVMGSGTEAPVQRPIRYGEHG